ncbi:MAG TPA: alpha/beta hydrolase [Bacteroidia bacterium]|nr:alpha/beta hydrolase [Bacteroidia bacterium]
MAEPAVILFVHGALGSKDQMEVFGKEFSHYKTVMFEFAGHGNSPDTVESWTIDAFEKQLEIWCNKLQVPVFIFGYSMGGYVALSLALKKPELFRGIMTLGTKFEWTRESAAKEAGKLNPEKILEKVPQFADELIRRHGRERWETVLRKTSEMMIDLGVNPLLTPDKMSKLKIPVLFCIGERDAMVSLSETSFIQAAAPGSGLKILKAMPHAIEQIPVDVITAEIKSFVCSIS